MANDATHVPAGPNPRPTDPNAPSTTAMPDIAPPASTPTTTPSTAASTEVMGRASPPSARTAASQPAATLVGAGSAVRTGRAATAIAAPVASSAASSGSTLDLSGAPPGWSFPAPFGRPDTEAAPPTSRSQTELPLEPVPAVRAAAPLLQPHFGPVGRSRPPLLVPLLAIVTLGVYALVWHQRMNRELEEFDPKLHSRPMRSAVALAVPWLAGVLVTLAGAALIVGSRLSVHLPLASHVSPLQSYLMLGGLAVVPYLTLLLPISLIAVVMTLERLRCVEEHVGTTTDRQVRPVGAALLLAVPVVGGLVLLAAEQRRLNAVWDAVAPSGRPYP
jgi:Domain of unknown function (DUF4234)